MWSSLLSLWLALSGQAPPRPAPRRRPAFRRPSCRPRLEALEDRCVPSGAPLDTTFGTGGIVTTSLSANTTVLGDLLQPNGDIIAYGTLAGGSSLFLARYTPSGSLDTTFGSGGIVETTTTLGSDPGQAALQANGQIVFADGVQLFRYNSNGSLDTTFGSNGVVTFSGFSGTAGIGHGGPGLLILPSNGDIVVGGNSALVAYTPNGSLDSTFGSGGEVVTPGGGRVTSLALENGDIVAGGITVPAVSGAVARYTLSGSLDTTFGSGGIAAFPGAVRSLVVQPNGQIIAVGNANGSDGMEWTLARYNVNGTLDSTFGSSGVVTSSPTGDDEAVGAALESDGLIVVVGLADLQGAEFGVYNPNGSPDANFGSGGFVKTGFSDSPNYAGDGVVIQPNGDLVIASSDGTAIALARYLPPGAQTSDSFAITGPTAFTAGTAGTFTLTALTPAGTPDTTYSGTVQITSSDPQAVLPANFTISGGSATFSATLKTAGSQSITATDTTTGSVTGGETGITVNPAAAASLVFSNVPGNTTAGSAFNVTLMAKDAYGNTATGYTATVHFTSTDGKAVLPANYTFTSGDAGSHTFSITLKKAGTQAVTATDIATGSLTATASGIVVNAAAASQFLLSAPSSVTSGSKFSLTLTVEDAYGNVVTGYTGTVHFTSSDSRATLPKNFTFTAADAGVYTFTNAAILKTTGTQTITVTDTKNSKLTDTDDIDVT